MTDHLITVVFSAVVLGCMTYMVVWGMHNFEITVNTIMPWADKQNTFLQKLVSCEMCLSVQASIALTTAHCLVFKLGLWSWIIICILSCLIALFLIRKIQPLNQ